MARGVIGKLPVVYDPVARRVVMENSAEFVETQIRQKLDRFAYDDAGSITMVQFVTGEGKKVLWPEA